MNDEKLKQVFYSQFNLVSTSEDYNIRFDDWYQKILAQYNEPHRFYHNIFHVKRMLMQLNHQELNNKPLILAIFFHDVIYDPKRNDNETESIKFFYEFGEELMADSVTLIAEVALFINCTIKHEVTACSKKHDLEAFLDLDLSILGSSWEDYKNYSDCIRKEYSHVPNDIFKSKRVEILRNFLNRKNLFFSRKFIDLYEKRARCNLKKEVEYLITYM